MLKARSTTQPGASQPKRKRTKSAVRTRPRAATLAARGKTARPKRPLRVVVMMSDEEHQRLLALCEDDVRPVASWFRVVVRRAWQARKPRRGAPGPFQRQEDDGERRRVEVWTRLSEEERDRLDVLAGEEDVSVAVWYRRRLREDFAARLGGKRRAPSPGKAPRRAAGRGATARKGPARR